MVTRRDEEFERQDTHIEPARRTVNVTVPDRAMTVKGM
jgi:hypothetical protein